MKSINTYLDRLLRISMILGVFCSSGTAFALNANSAITTADSIVVTDSLLPDYPGNEDSSFVSVLQPLRHAQAQSNRSSLRSKSEVMQEVKNRYNGQVVKISLNDRTATYSVRVLLPNGKVKNLSVSARK